jgi:hypothetical protein
MPTLACSEIRRPPLQFLLLDELIPKIARRTLIA